MKPTINFSSGKQFPARHRGAVLLVSLVILTVLTVLGMSAIDSSGMQTRMANNQKERLIAMQGAEAALREAEFFIEQGGIPSDELGSLPASCAEKGICFEGTGALTPASCVGLPPAGVNADDYMPQDIRESVDPFGLYDPDAGTAGFNPSQGTSGPRPISLGSLEDDLRYAVYTIQFKCYVPGTQGDLVTVDPHQLFTITAYAVTESGRGRVMLRSNYKKRS